MPSKKSSKIRSRTGGFFARVPVNNPGLCGAMIVVVVASIILGGASYGPGLRASIVSLLSAILVAVAIHCGALRELAKLQTGAKLFAAAVILIPAAQLIPLPPSLWQFFPGREVEHQIYDLVGAGGQWHSISLNPFETGYTMLLMLPPAAVFLGTLACDRKDRWTIIYIILGLAFFSIALGLLQFSSGGRILNFYDSSHKNYLLGFFANRNHQGLFVASALAFCISVVFKFVRNPRTAFLFSFLVALFAISAAIATASRSGLFLTAFVAFFVISINMGFGNRSWRTFAAMILAALALFWTLQQTSDVFERVFDRYATVDQDGRWQFWENSLEIAKLYFPMGTGLGTFEPVYMKFEILEQIESTYVNHAHNDYLELFVELGVGAIVILFLFLVAFVQALGTKKPWTKGGLSGSATAIILIVAIHSIVDYPLRTEAMAVIFAFAVAVLLERGESLKKDRSRVAKSTDR